MRQHTLQLIFENIILPTNGWSKCETPTFWFYIISPFINLLQFIADILNPNYAFESTNPHIGIWSTLYLLRKADGIPSTPARLLASSLYSSVSIRAISFDWCSFVSDTSRRLLFFCLCTRQFALFGHASHIWLSKCALYTPFLYLLSNGFCFMGHAFTSWLVSSISRLHNRFFHCFDFCLQDWLAQG